MSYLDKPLTTNGYFEHIVGLSDSYKHQSKYALDHFEKFCISQYQRDTKTVLDDSLKQKRDESEKHIKNLFGLLQDFINYLSLQGQDPTTIRGNFNLVKSYLNWYGFEIYNEFIKSRLKFPKKIQREDYALTIDDIKKILDNSPVIRKTLYLFLSATGMRIGEAMKIRKRDLDVTTFDRIMVVIPGKYTKTKKPRRTFITKECEKYLNPILKKKKDDDLLFTINQDSEKAKHTEEEYFSRMRIKAGLEQRYDNKIHKISLHSFRSWFVTKCNRIDSDFGNALAGHSKYMKQYDRMTDEEKYELYLKAEKTLSIYERIDETQEKRIIDLERKLAEVTDLLDLDSGGKEETMFKKLLERNLKRYDDIEK